MELQIEQDLDPMNPREDPILGTMACWHGRYSLGDEQPDCDPQEYLKGLGDIISLPLYLYDHGGITMNTTGFHCPWDSGQVGYIYVTKKSIREEFGWKRISKKRYRQVEEILEAEVKIYDHYISGEVYGFILEEDGEEVDSCWGFYGPDHHSNGLADHIPEELHHQL